MRFIIPVFVSETFGRKVGPMLAKYIERVVSEDMREYYSNDVHEYFSSKGYETLAKGATDVKGSEVANKSNRTSFSFVGKKVSTGQIKEVFIDFNSVVYFATPEIIKGILESSIASDSYLDKIKSFFNRSSEDIQNDSLKDSQVKKAFELVRKTYLYRNGSVKKGSFVSYVGSNVGILLAYGVVFSKEDGVVPFDDESMLKSYGFLPYSGYVLQVDPLKGECLFFSPITKSHDLLLYKDVLAIATGKTTQEIDELLVSSGSTGVSSSGSLFNVSMDARRARRKALEMIERALSKTRRMGDK